MRSVPALKTTTPLHNTIVPGNLITDTIFAVCTRLTRRSHLLGLQRPRTARVLYSLRKTPRRWTPSPQNAQMTSRRALLVRSNCTILYIARFSICQKSIEVSGFLPLIQMGKWSASLLLHFWQFITCPLLCCRRSFRPPFHHSTLSESCASTLCWCDFRLDNFHHSSRV